MDSNQFDALTRQLAGGVPRRQILKGLLSFAVGSVLANFGFKSPTPTYAESGVNQSGDEALFLPYVSRICDVASTCEDKVMCGPDCRCLLSAEGDIQCGQILNSLCSAEHCKSSADCAHLGEGYFCDTPNSGCCADKEVTRCIPPCGGACPDEKKCGSKCCADKQTCSAGTCISSYDCELSAITKATISASLAALADGATSVDLTPQGCIKITQQIVKDQVISRSFVIADRTISNWSISGNQRVAWRDSDRDGFHEWTSVTTLGANDDQFQTVETESSPETKKPTVRTTITPNGDMTHFVVDEMQQSGQWKKIAEYETPRIQAATLGEAFLSGEAGELSPFATPPPCEANPCNPAEIKKRMEEGLDRAVQCLADYGQKGQDIFEAAYNIMQRNMTVRCATIPGKPQANIGGWDNPNGRLTVTVDPAKYCALTEEQRSWLMFHEILHASLQRGHTPGSDDLPEEQVKQIDRVYGCMAFCYNNRNVETRCMCAQCLGTVTCDPICAPFNADCGATCPCPAKDNKYYNKCSECLADCPSGLGCFGFLYCDPVGQSPLCPPVLCPA